MTLMAAIKVFTSGMEIGYAFADSIYRRASLVYLRYVVCSRRLLGQAVVWGHVDVMTPMSHWPIRTSSKLSN
jgi:hypothetical protein